MLDRLFDTLTNIVHWFIFWTVVDSYDSGVVLRLGKFHREIGPGIHWLAPFGLEDARTVATVPYTEQLRPQSITTKDGVSVVVSMVITWRIVNVRTFILEVCDGAGAVLDSVVGAVGPVISGKDAEDALGRDCAKEIIKLARTRAKKWGVQIQDLQFADLVRAQSFRVFGSLPPTESEE